MKKQLLLPLFLFASFISFSQGITTEKETTSSEEIVYKRDIAKNELSIGTLNLVAFGALDVAYERIITPNSSWAIEAFVLALDRDNEDIGDAFNKDVSLTGKYKYFFGDRTAWGFYVNGLAMISSGKYSEYNEYFVDDIYYSNREKISYTDFALGFGLGGKFVGKQGFFLDLSTGIGRNLFNDNSPVVVGQFNVNLGFRF
ncbi:hypothetical protein BC962_1363 [Gillisia mitskevichiae]|uniref:Outer membrane protein with beta-barrel domain n=1 Tax=Gillisia mitskevichiae TaxID=270921 RepID=A0A495PSE0_9FLAO|nr:hypothetical protein [Gillisia mitskevichiae]RKS53117.1 hypothetical protein BC962_1363 [Gillisia mitskevichiae]